MDRTGLVAIGSMLIFAVTASDACAQTDWDLYALRLTNRARSNPTAEAAIIGSSVVDNRAPLPPLALHRLVCQAAKNHVNWMHDNFGTIPSGFVPDTWTIFESTDGRASGAAAVGTPSFTGKWPEDRLEAVGFDTFAVSYLYSVGPRWSAGTMDSGAAAIEGDHKARWEDNGFRSAILHNRATFFGHDAETRTFFPPRGGLSPPIDHLRFWEMNVLYYSTTDPRRHIFGVVYRDRNSDGAWTPREEDDPFREGLPGVACIAYIAGTDTAVASETTMPNGAFSLLLAPGSYDVAIAIPEGVLWIHGVQVVDQNVEVGDVEVLGPEEFFEACLSSTFAFFETGCVR